MRNTPNLKVEKHRLTLGAYSSTEAMGNNGMFEIPYKSMGLRVVCSDSAGWDHVSVSVIDGQWCPVSRTPTWAEMKHVRDLFFKDDEWAVQYNPPEKDNVNNHEFTLHLWRPQGVSIPKPSSWMVGDKSKGTLQTGEAKTLTEEIMRLEVDEHEERFGYFEPVAELACAGAAAIAIATIAIEMTGCERGQALLSLTKKLHEIEMKATAQLGFTSDLRSLVSERSKECFDDVFNLCKGVSGV